MSCKYCKPDDAGNLAFIEEDGNHLLTYLEDWGTKWVLTNEVNTICCGTECWTRVDTEVRYCPMCGEKLPSVAEVDA